MPVQIKLEIFEGPLDLLLHLIDRAEIDIYNIPIKEITDQYMAYLRSLQYFDLEPTSEFLVMAATLLSIKSKMLLPKPPKSDDDEEEQLDDPREELVRRLLEYRKYKEIAEYLREQEADRSQIYSKEPDDLSRFAPEILDNPVRGIHAADLMIIFGKLLKRAERRNEVLSIHRDTVSVHDRVQEILHLFSSGTERLLFSSLLVAPIREEIVVTFLAVLELMKQRKIRCYQEDSFSDIVIVYVGEKEDRLDGADANDEVGMG